MIPGVRYIIQDIAGFLQANTSNSEMVAWMTKHKAHSFYVDELDEYGANELIFPDTDIPSPSWFCINSAEFKFFVEASSVEEEPLEVSLVEGEFSIKVFNEVTRKAAIEHLQRIKFED